jgi:hypothetical protein
MPFYVEGILESSDTTKPKKIAVSSVPYWDEKYPVYRVLLNGTYKDAKTRISAELFNSIQGLSVGDKAEFKLDWGHSYIFTKTARICGHRRTRTHRHRKRRSTRRKSN